MPRSLERAFHALEVLCARPGGLSLSEASLALSCPKSSALRLFRVLIEKHYVVREGSRYCLGSGIFQFAADILAARELPALLRPFLRQLADRTQETAYLVALDAQVGVATYIDVIESPQPVRYSTRVGVQRPLYCAAAGRVLLAHQSEAWIEDYLARTPLVARTAATITNVRALKQEMKKILAEGIAISDGEAAVGAAGVAAPVFDSDGAVHTALLVGGPRDRLIKETRRIAPLLRELSKQASRVLGYNPSQGSTDKLSNEKLPLRKIRSATGPQEGRR
jgi:DNA-binding IclR family transcriptional regulator